MTQKNNLFTPIDGVIIEIQKQENKAGIEIAGASALKNEGIIISNDIFFSPKKMGELQKISDGIIIIDGLKKVFAKGRKIKFTEGYDLGNNTFFVLLKSIIGIYGKMETKSK